MPESLRASTTTTPSHTIIVDGQVNHRRQLQLLQGRRGVERGELAGDSRCFSREQVLGQLAGTRESPRALPAHHQDNERRRLEEYSGNCPVMAIFAYRLGTAAQSMVLPFEAVLFARNCPDPGVTSVPAG